MAARGKFALVKQKGACVKKQGMVLFLFELPE